MHGSVGSSCTSRMWTPKKTSATILVRRPRACISTRQRWQWCSHARRERARRVMPAARAATAATEPTRVCRLMLRLLSQATGRPVRRAAERQDEMGGRTSDRVLIRPTGGFGCRRKHRGGTTSMVADARRAPGIQPARNVSPFFSRDFHRRHFPRRACTGAVGCVQQRTNNAPNSSGLCRRCLRRNRNHQERTCAVAQRGVAVLDRPVASPSRLQNTLRTRSFLDERRRAAKVDDGDPTASVTSATLIN